MKNPIYYVPMQSGEEKQVIDFVISVFDEFVAPQYSSEGKAEFRKYAHKHACAERSKTNSFKLIAKISSEPIGMIEMIDHSHVAMFFAKKSFQRQGVGKALLEKAVDICRAHFLDLHKITVNASPTSVSAYKRMVFFPVLLLVPNILIFNYKTNNCETVLLKTNF